MNGLQRCVVEFATVVSKGVLHSVVDALIEQGEINAVVLERRVTHHHSKELLRRLLREAAEHHVSAPRLAGLLDGASSIVEHYQEWSPELVWTGPTTPYAASRRTEQVVLEVIRAAQCKVILTSFVAYQVDRIVEALREATKRGVEVKLLMELSEEDGGRLTIDSISMMRCLLPQARFYAWHDKPAEFEGGCVHAKIILADDVKAFITSANLTGHAMERNMEAGVLLHGGGLVNQLADHLEALITTNVVSAL